MGTMLGSGEYIAKSNVQLSRVSAKKNTVLSGTSLMEYSYFLLEQYRVFQKDL
jgi:hypothetical protein